MKTKLLIFLSCLASYMTSAQEVPIELIDRANAVEFIFEGEVIESNSYYSHNSRYIQTSNTVLITRVLKGDIDCDTNQTVTTIPSGEKDFYAVILHELGHAHGLHHIINENAVMHYKVNNQQRIIDLPNDAPSDEGGNWIANRTNNLSIPMYGLDYERMEFDSIKPCSHNISIIEHVQNEKFDVNLYPNPCSYNLNIEIPLYKGNQIDILIFDIQGNLIVKTKMNTDENNSFNTSELGQGTYILRLMSHKGELMSAHKFVKL